MHFHGTLFLSVVALTMIFLFLSLFLLICQNGRVFLQKLSTTPMIVSLIHYCIYNQVLSFWNFFDWLILRVSGLHLFFFPYIGMTESSLLRPGFVKEDGQLDLVLKLQITKLSTSLSFTLLGRFIGGKILNRGTVQLMIQKLWNFGGVIATTYVSPNTYSISVDSYDCFQRILDQSPWHFIGKLFIDKEWNHMLSADEVDLNSIAFWDQVHNLPLDYLNAENVPHIGKQLGQLIGFEDSLQNGVMIHPFLGIRILLPIDKPLKLGFWLHKPNNDHCQIKFHYEQLQHFCYGCGILGHEQRECHNPRVWGPNTPNYK